MSSFLDPGGSMPSRPPRPLTIAQVAHRFGVCRKTVERMLGRGEFVGAYKVGRSWRIPPAVVEAYERESVARVQAEASKRQSVVSSRVPSGPLASPESRRGKARTLASGRK